MQGHWLSGTRKLNRHYQSGGEFVEQLVLFDIPQTNPVTDVNINRFSIGSNFIYSSSGNWNGQVKKLKLKNRRYVLKWNLHDLSGGRFMGVVGASGHTKQLVGLPPVGDVAYVAGATGDRPRPWFQCGLPAIDDIDDTDVTATWLTPYSDYDTTLGTIHYKYVSMNSNNVNQQIIFDFTNTPRQILNETDVIVVSFLGNFNSYFTGDVLYGKMWLEPI